MRKIIPLLVVGFTAFPMLSHADNIATCEVVLMEDVLDSGEKTGAKVASFRPAAAFMSSVYDDEDDFLKKLDGHDIRGVMCERHVVIPTLRDFPILATGLPFSLSQNFDSAESSLMTVHFKEGKFHHTYKGPPLSDSEASKLDDVMEIFNLQPHDLGEKSTKGDRVPVPETVKENDELKEAKSAQD